MKYVMIFLVSLTLMFGCDYLDMVPEKDIETVETIFEQRSTAEKWWLALYGRLVNVIPTINANPSYVGTDELVAGEFMRKQNPWPGFGIIDGLQMPQEPYGNAWLPLYIVLRNCNTYLEHIDGVYNMEESEKRYMKADVQALKAFVYFELVRRYGPIVLIPENLPVDADISTLQLPRQHVDTCFKEIVTLLDESKKYIRTKSLIPQSHAFAFNLEAVAALKARVLLYAASPLFNGSTFFSDFKGKNGEPLFSSTYDREKWRLAAEAADEAAKICGAGGIELISGNSEGSTELLNTMKDIELSVFSLFDNKESILEWKTYEGFSFYFLPLLLGDDNNYSDRCYGSLSPSMKMVEMYYTEHGLPIDADNMWNYAGRYQVDMESSVLYEKVVPLNTRVLQLHLRREPRFYANIAGDRMYWQRGKNSYFQDYNLLVKAYKGEVPWGTRANILVSNDWQNISGYWCKKYTCSDWDTKSYHYNFNNNEAIQLIRLAEVYLMQAEAWNEYLEQPDNRVYDPLDKVRTRAGIPDVRTAWKSYSKTPDKVDTREGMRDIIRREINIEFAFEGHRFWNLRRWETAHLELNGDLYGWNILGETERAFYNNYESPIVVSSRNKFTAPRDYFIPIKAEEVLISNVVQNPGWQ